jgi:photosystem II stability/assembly factor-like uncharacterized protein
MKNLKNILIVTTLLLTNSVWAHFGSKGPFGGSVTCSTTIADTVYIGTAEGGVYESTNNTLVGWRARVVGLKSGKITGLAHTGKFLFAATADSGVFVFNGYAGSDRYWKKASKGLPTLAITSIIAVDLNTLMVGTNSGVFISTDLGANWTEVNNGLHHFEVTGFAKAGSRIFLITEDGGVAYTDDNGANWSSFNDSNTEHIAGTLAINYNATTNELMVLNENGLYVATDVTNTTTPTYTIISSTLDAHVKVNSISSTPTDWYVTSDSLVFVLPVSTTQWMPITTGLEKLSNKTTTTFVAFKSFFVLGTSADGLYKASTPFTTWTQLNTGFNNLKTSSMASSGTGLIVAATEKGVFVSKDLATTYVSANKGLKDSLNVQDIIIADFCMLAATKNNGVFFTADSGKTWVEANNGLMNLNIVKLFYSNMKKYAFCSSGNVYESPLHSYDWTMIQTGLPSGVKPTSLAFFGKNILLSTLGNGVYIKSTSSTIWTEYNNGLSNLDVTYATALNNKIYVGTNGSGVFVSDSTLSQIQWNAAAPIAISHLSLVELDPSKIQTMNAYGNYVFASYKGGVAASADNGVTWVPGGNQFNLPSFTDVNKIQFVTTRVFVPTQNNSLYSNSLSELPNFVLTSIRTSDIKTDVFFASPNPSNGLFSINTDKIKNKIESIEVYNMIGEKLLSTTNVLDQIYIQNGRGVYILFVKTNDQVTYVQKVVVD